MKTVIVTGSAGLVGSEAVRQFAALGYNIVGIDNCTRFTLFGDGGWNKPVIDRLELELDHYAHAVEDIRDSDRMSAIFSAVREVEAVIHTAAQPSHDWAATRPHEDFAINATGTLNVLEATRRWHPKAAFVHCSTNKVYGDHPNNLPFSETATRFKAKRNQYSGPFWLDPEHGIDEDCPIDHCTHSLFGCSKLAADLYVQEYGRYFGMNTACFRGGCLTGPGHAGVEQHGFLSYLCKCAVNGTPYKVIGYGGKQVRDNIHASDLVRAFVEYVNNPTPGAVYNIGGGSERSCSVLEAIALAERLSGRTMTLEHVPEPRKGDHRWWVTDTRKFEAAYPDWRQEYTLERTMQEIIEAHTERQAA
jgi:CDP-paratose 2-epimerase